MLSQEHAQFCWPSLDDPLKLSPSHRLSERQPACGEDAHAMLFNPKNGRRQPVRRVDLGTLPGGLLLSTAKVRALAIARAWRLHLTLRVSVSPAAWRQLRWLAILWPLTAKVASARRTTKTSASLQISGWRETQPISPPSIRAGSRVGASVA